jgi:hypothetical protein
VRFLEFDRLLRGEAVRKDPAYAFSSEPDAESLITPIFGLESGYSVKKWHNTDSTICQFWGLVDLRHFCWRLTYAVGLHGLFLAASDAFQPPGALNQPLSCI